MKRKFLFSFYETPPGKILQRLESDFLKQSITVTYKQSILQIGGLDWENEFIDYNWYQQYYIIDTKGAGSTDSKKILASSFNLPIKSESIDLVLLPHLLEFDAKRFQTMREIERVLKPEGQLIVLNFNPWNIWVRLQLIWNKRMTDTWRGHFITRSRITDWLKLLNFEIIKTTEFTVNNMHNQNGQFQVRKETLYAMSYAVKAIKRQYTLIPLTPVKAKPSRILSVTSGLKKIFHKGNKHDG